MLWEDDTLLQWNLPAWIFWGGGGMRLDRGHSWTKPSAQSEWRWESERVSESGLEEATKFMDRSLSIRTSRNGSNRRRGARGLDPTSTWRRCDIAIEMGSKFFALGRWLYVFFDRQINIGENFIVEFTQDLPCGANIVFWVFFHAWLQIGKTGNLKCRDHGNVMDLKSQSKYMSGIVGYQTELSPSTLCGITSVKST